MLSATILLDSTPPGSYSIYVDRANAIAKMAERCPWCGGRVTTETASEPGELTLIRCNGSVFGDLPCKWSVSGDDALRILDAASHMKQTA